MPPVPGATTVTVAPPLLATAVGVPGVPGAAFAVGLTELEAADEPEVPTPLVAVEVKVYDVPGVSPETTHDVAGDVTVHV